jgi:hypothetical protein
MPRTSDRSARTLPLSAIALKSAAKALKKRGFVQGAIVGRWVEIVGEALAAVSMPERLVFPGNDAIGATLHIKVAGPLALELQHLAPIVIERINSHFGYAAVSGIRLHQGLVTRRPRPTPAPAAKLRPAEEERLAGLVRGVKDEGLQAALAELGRAVIAGGDAPPK